MFAANRGILVFELIVPGCYVYTCMCHEESGGEELTISVLHLRTWLSFVAGLLTRVA